MLFIPVTHAFLMEDEISQINTVVAILKANGEAQQPVDGLAPFLNAERAAHVS